MISKTEDEKLFNKQAKKYGITAFTAQDFKKDEDLTKAFKSFVSGRNFILEDDFSNLDELDSYYLDFFENHSSYNKENIHTKAEEVESTTKLFDLIVPLREISCKEYYEIETQGFVNVNIENGIADDNILKKIEFWHEIRRSVDKIKPFIQKRFPEWEHAEKEKKIHYKNEIEELIHDLETLGDGTKQLKRVWYFMKKNYALNQTTKFKVEILLLLKLPHINTRQIANKIIKNTKL